MESEVIWVPLGILLGGIGWCLVYLQTKKADKEDFVDLKSDVKDILDKVTTLQIDMAKVWTIKDR